MTISSRTPSDADCDFECVEVAQAFSSWLAGAEMAYEAVAWSLRVIEAVLY